MHVKKAIIGLNNSLSPARRQEIVVRCIYQSYQSRVSYGVSIVMISEKIDRCSWTKAAISVIISQRTNPSVIVVEILIKQNVLENVVFPMAAKLPWSKCVKDILMKKMLHNQRYACYERVPDNITNDRQLLKYVYNIPMQSTPIISLSTWFQSDMQQKTALTNFDNCL